MDAEDLLLELRKVSAFPRDAEFSVAFVLLLSFAEAGFLALLPVAFGLLLDMASRQGIQQLLFTVVAQFAAGALAIAALGLLNDRLYAKIRRRAEARLRRSVFERLRQLPMPFYQRPDTRNLQEELSSAVDAVAAAWESGLSRGLAPALQSMVCVPLLFWIDWRAASVALLLLPWMLLSPRFFERRLASVRRDLHEAADSLPGPPEESLRYQPAVRAFALEDMLYYSFSKRQRARTQSIVRVASVAALAARLPALGTLLLQLFVVALGFTFLAENSITPGRMVTLVLLTFLLGAALEPLGAWLVVWSRARQALVSIPAHLDHPGVVLDNPDAKPFPGLSQEILFENVLAGISVRIPRGAYVAFVGLSGTGKTALLNLLLRFEDAGTGMVAIDGTDVRTFAQSSLRRRIGLVPRDRSLFNASLLENIRLGRPDASLEAIVDVAKAVGLDLVIAAMPKGLDTPAGVNGENLGNEAAQRLALARALIRRPEILLLDEIGYDLDPAADAALQRNVQRLALGRTVVAAASRISSAMYAGTIIVLQGGRIVEQGSHEALLAANGYYAALFEKQSGFRFSPDGRHVTVHAARLRLLPDFENLGDSVLTELADRFATEVFPAGRAIVQEGDPTDKLYILVRGTVQTSRGGKADLVLQDGDCFGAPAGTVTTLTACTCVSLERYHFDELAGAGANRDAAGV